MTCTSERDAVRVATLLLALLGAACADDARDTSPNGATEAPADEVDNEEEGIEEEEPSEEVIPFEDAKILFEHNATDEDTGIQAFLDGEPWNRLTILGPDGTSLLEIDARNQLRDLGLTELFFETNEPPNEEVPIAELFARFPQGQYRFEGRSIDGARMTGTAILSHCIPAGPEILSPAEGAAVDPGDAVVAWEPVDEAVAGGCEPEIGGYELVVEEDVELHPPGFSKIVLSIHVPASITSLTIPKEFLQPGTAYKFEVLALEAGGAQTITSSEFETE